jgi:transposase
MKVEEILGKMKEEVFVLKPLTHKQLAEMYGVSWLTFQNWIKKVEKEVGKKTGHFYHVSQVRKIFQLFGIPKQINVAVSDVEELFKSQR